VVVQRQWDVIVVGAGSGGMVAAQEFANRDRSVLAVEADRFGGDDITDNKDDSSSRKSLEESGIATLRGRAQLVEETVRTGRPVKITPEANHDVIVGAICVGPESDLWGAGLALAIRARAYAWPSSRQPGVWVTYSSAVSSVCRLSSWCTAASRASR
jgi:choline dehydrogenase-like flavoprotein